ncbi:hypothetical protein ACSBR2_027123 [Camellia fascicularis]
MLNSALTSSKQDLGIFRQYYVFSFSLQIFVKPTLNKALASDLSAGRMILTCAFAADPDDPLKTTDQTRRLGLIELVWKLFRGQCFVNF